MGEVAQEQTTVSVPASALSGCSPKQEAADSTGSRLLPRLSEKHLPLLGPSQGQAEKPGDKTESLQPELSTGKDGPESLARNPC